ncbi:MAG: SDR family oxidoreductase [Rubinisphaera brasiliensis]|uniref:3-oxoacyl-(Acyl-carrier-protein) reductase n=1 Tax=Rubinisphaera brasiliensis (strain ATCC 49424 / DSM 5305 / JCM 21570 / IAM 15109 / NBRC 103401 / IFAM 1448) TaxID=756272 RepID=F0SLV9_RUBBR|nr:MULTISPECIES: SDR family oxidoreductase [Rubinisphaera]ADY59884.1 3-oxoacyl-(acyl-carrier-protein) reductase [Rubinisphaera brasiliensis DSM 5305]MBR9802530.1 SDR family oxidoreductase [bacterium]
MSQDKPLGEKKVLITGGGSGIGQAIALGLARLGCQIVIAGRNEQKLKDVAAQAADNIHVVSADVSQRDAVRELISKATETLGQIDILVNAAGINVAQRMMHNLDPADWDKMMEINASGAFHCIQETLPQMRERNDGVIINISSVSGIRAAPLGGVAYNASKFAMTALGISAGEEEKGNGVRVTNIYPGEVDTPILANRPAPVSDEHREKILQPEDVASAVLMVLSLPARARVPELSIIPTQQSFV